MSLEYKSSVRENITNIQTYIVDESQKSTKYFRVSDVPQVLQKGKNLLRITAHPTNLVPDTQIYVDVRDSNGNAIYYEIPDYLENDKSRVISIWIYHDKGDDNTPNGEATITLAGIANVDMDGNPLPQRHRGKLNVKWQTTVSVDRDRNNTSEIIFSPTITPTLIVSQSTEQYQNQPQSGDILSLTTQTGKVQYIFKGKTPIVEIKDSSTLNGEMVGGSIILNNFTKPAEPIANIENPLSSTFFSSSIKEVLTNKVLKPITNFTTSFANRDDLTHTFGFVGEANYKIEYVQSGSNVSTQNKRNFVNITLDNIDPITGVVNKIKILHKSEGLPGDFELLNEVEVPFSSSVSIKVPIPSKNLKDPKILKLLYLNADGGISRTQTISNPFVFDGDNIYIGGEENLISGSIFISNTLGTGIEIGGASSGFMRSVGYRGITSASLGKAPGGFVIYSGSGNLVFGEDPLLGVGMQFVGDNDDRHLVFSTANGGILDVKTDKFFIGNLNQQYISGSDGNIEISSSIFHLDPKANGGAGSLVIGANATINADLTVDNLRTPASIGGLASTETNSSSSIKSDGFARFVSASIGGWGITTSSIEGGNLIMKPEGILQTRDFASGLKGWKISSEGNGTAEFENVRIRGTLRTTTFEKESVNAVGGQLWVANSTTITGSVTSGETTMSVKNASGFSAGEILLAKKVDNTGFQTEYILLESASVEGDNSNEDETYGRIYVQRAYGSGQQGDFVGDLASSAQAYEDGQVIVSTGKLNTGYIKMNANPNDTATPYMDIVERTGSGLYDVALKVRLGDLSGLANSDYVFGNSNPGFGLATDNVFLQGGIIAKTGSIGGIKMDDGKLFTGEGTYNNSNTGFYVDSGSNFSLGSKLAWNPTTEALTVRGSFQFADGTSVQTAIDNVSSGSVARTVELSADKYVVTFDESGNESPSNQTITLTATPQNFVGQVYYEYYKDSTIQGTRGTANTFTVDTTAEKPTSSTPKTYEVRAFTGSNGGTAVSTDSLTLFGLQPGSDGAAGTDAVTAFLTNESHTLPLSSSGVIQSYAGADTQIKVYEGITDKTSNYTFTESSPAYITATSSSNTFTITNSTTPYSGSVTITAVSESVSLSKIMSIGITRQGDDGSDGTPGANAKTITLTSDTQTFAFDDSTDTDATPTSAVFSINQQNLSGAIVGTDITITKVGSSGTINTPTVSGTTTNGTGTRTFTLPFSSLSKSDLPLTISVTKDGVTDSTSIIKIEGGANGVSALQYLLTNEAHIVPASSAGIVSSYTNSGTEVYVYEGSTELVYDGVGTSNGTWKVTTPIVSPTGKITVGTVYDRGDSAEFDAHSSMDNDTDSVTISYPISGKTTDGTSFSFTKTQTIAKSKEGSDGLPGTSASLISLTGDSQVFAFASASATTPDDTTIELFITQQNLGKTLTASDITIIDAFGGNITTNIPTFSPTSLSNNSGVISGSLVFSTLNLHKSKYPITITATSGSLSDSFKIFALDGGADGTSGEDAYTVFLTNESHTFPAAFNGDVDSSNLAAGATDVRIFKGTTQLTNDNNSPYGANTYRATSAVSGITMSSTKPGSDRRFTPTAVTNDSGTATITITDNTTGTAFTKTYTFSKSKEGAAGAEGSGSKTVSLTAATNVVTYDADGLNPSPSSTIALSANSQNFTDGYFKFTGDGITDETSYTNGASANGDTKNFTVPSSYFSTPKTIRVGVSEANQTELTFDTVTIVAVQPGAAGAAGSDAVTAFLTSEADVIPAAFNGTVSSFAGSGTTMKVYEGITDKSTGAGYTYTLVNTTTGLTATLSNNILTISGLTPDSGSTDIRATSGSVTIDKTYSVAKSKAGPAGANNQDFSYLDASLTGIGPISSPGLLMNSEVFGFHNGISGTNGSLSDFTSFLDDSGNFYLGGNSGGMSGSAATSGYLAWNNTDRSLLISGSNANIEVDKFFLGTGTSQYISGSNGNVEIAGDVTFRGRPDNGDGNVVFFDDFSQYAGAGAVDGGNFPKNDGTGDAWWFNKKPEVALVTDSDCISGQALQIGNNAGDDEANLFSNQLIPFNESSLYEVEVRIKRTAGNTNSRAYVGISGMKPDGTTKVGYGGGNDTSGHYVTLQGNNLGTGSGTGYFQIFKGYLKGTGTDHHFHDSKTDPANVRTEILNGYIRAYMLLNYDNQPGRTIVDYIKIKEFSSGGTSRISGDSITTGTIKSNNLSTTVGTSLGLNEGIMQIGGTGAYISTNGILLDGPNAKFAVGYAAGNYMRFNHTAGKLEINTPNFTIDNSGNVAVSGNITVSNPNDFADPGANVTTEAVFYKFGDMGAAPITSDNFYISNLQQNAITQTDGGTPISANKFESTLSGGYGAGWDSGYATKTTFSASLEPILSYDVVFNQGANGSSGTAQYPPYHMFGFSDVDSDSDVSTSNNYSHLTHGIYITRKLVSSVYYNTFEVRENGGNGVGNSDWYTVNGLTGNATNGPWISGEDTFYRFTIQLKKGGGAIYKAFKNGNFLVPVWSYVSTSTTHTGKHSFLATTYWGYNNGNRKEFITEQLAIGAAPAPGTIISGDGITAGTIVSTNLSANSGSQFKLDDGTFKLGGTTSPKLSFDGTTLSVKGNIQVEGGGFGSGAGELFGNPTGHLLDSNGRPGGWSASL